MYKVETKHHIIQTNSNDKPAFACAGLCGSVWWKEDVPDYSPMTMLHCEKCGGILRTAKPEDYKVIEFKITPQNNQFGLMLIHRVKEGSEEFAKANWC